MTNIVKYHREKFLTTVHYSARCNDHWVGLFIFELTGIAHSSHGKGISQIVWEKEKSTRLALCSMGCSTGMRTLLIDMGHLHFPLAWCHRTIGHVT